MDFNRLYRGIAETVETFNIKKQVGFIKQVLHEDSMYPNKRRKSYSKRLVENISWYFRHGEACRFYNSYGFDIEGWRDQSTYMPYRRFRIERNNENYEVKPFYTFENRTCILRDKILFSAYLGKVLGSQYVIKDLGRLDQDGSVWNFQVQKETDLYTLLKEQNKDVFIKKLMGECGDGCYLIKKGDNISDSFLQETKGSTYIIQESLQQHEILNEINPSCVNTIRLVTIYNRNTGNVGVLGHYIRFGVNRINDNQATGGIAVGISTDGKLYESGLGHHSSNVSKHPVTGVSFKDVVIPFWDEAVALAMAAHKELSSIISIGWDIAITPSGPVLLEGNDNWELSAMQEPTEGLKKRWYELRENA